MNDHMQPACTYIFQKGAARPGYTFYSFAIASFSLKYAIKLCLIFTINCDYIL